MGNFYLAITHLVSVFNEAGGKICLLHIEVKTTKSEGIYSIIVNGKLANKFLVQQLHIEQPYTYTTPSHRTTLYIYNTLSHFWIKQISCHLVERGATWLK